MTMILSYNSRRSDKSGIAWQPRLTMSLGEHFCLGHIGQSPGYMILLEDVLSRDREERGDRRNILSKVPRQRLRGVGHTKPGVRR